MKSCNKCCFALKEGEVIFCHRAPPVPVVLGDQLSFIWPAVLPTAWCGEFKLAWKRLFRGHVAS